MHERSIGIDDRRDIESTRVGKVAAVEGKLLKPGGTD